MIKRILTTYQTLEDRIRALERETSDPSFIEVLLNPREFIVDLVPFVRHILEEISPQPEGLYNRENEIRVFALKLLARMNYRGLFSTADAILNNIIESVFNVFEVDNSFNKQLGLRVLHALLDAEPMVEISTYVNRINKHFISDQLVDVETSDESKVCLCFHVAAEGIEFLSSLQAKFNFSYSVYDPVFSTISRNLNCFFSASKLFEKYKGSKQVLPEYIYFSKQILKFANSLCVPSHHSIMAYAPDLCTTMVFFCPPDCWMLRKEILDTVLETMSRRHECFSSVELYFDLNKFFNINYNPLKAYSLDVFTSILNLGNKYPRMRSNSTAIYLQYERCIAGLFCPDLSVVYSCINALSANLEMYCTYPCDLNDKRLFLLKNLKNAYKLYQLLHSSNLSYTRYDHPHVRDDSEAYKYSNNNNEAIYNDSSTTNGLYNSYNTPCSNSNMTNNNSMCYSDRVMEAEFNKKKIEMWDTANILIDFIQFIIQAISHLKLPPRTFEFDELRVLAKLFLFPLNDYGRSNEDKMVDLMVRKTISYFNAYITLPAEDVEMIIELCCDDLILKYYHKAYLWSHMLNHLKASQVLIRAANKLIHKDFVFYNYKNIEFYQSIFPIAHGFFIFHKDSPIYSFNNLFGIVYEHILHIRQPNPVTEKNFFILLDNIHNFLKGLGANCYIGSYFLFHFYEVAIRELYTLYCIRRDVFYIQCLFNIPLSLNLLVFKYEYFLKPMEVALNEGKELRDQVLKYIEYILEFDANKGAMNSLLRAVFHIQTELGIDTSNVLARMSDLHRTTLNNTGIFKHKLLDSPKIRMQAYTYFDMSPEDYKRSVKKRKNRRGVEQPIRVELPLDNTMRGLIADMIEYEFVFDHFDFKGHAYKHIKTRTLRRVEKKIDFRIRARRTLINYMTYLLGYREFWVQNIFNFCKYVSNTSFDSFSNEFSLHCVFLQGTYKHGLDYYFRIYQTASDILLAFFMDDSESTLSFILTFIKVYATYTRKLQDSRQNDYTIAYPANIFADVIPDAFVYGHERAKTAVLFYLELVDSDIISADLKPSLNATKHLNPLKDSYVEIQNFFEIAEKLFKVYSSEQDRKKAGTKGKKTSNKSSSCDNKVSNNSDRVSNINDSNNINNNGSKNSESKNESNINSNINNNDSKNDDNTDDKNVSPENVEKDNVPISCFKANFIKARIFDCIELVYSESDLKRCRSLMAIQFLLECSIDNFTKNQKHKGFVLDKSISYGIFQAVRHALKTHIICSRVFDICARITSLVFKIFAIDGQKCFEKVFLREANSFDYPLINLLYSQAIHFFGLSPVCEYIPRFETRDYLRVYSQGRSELKEMKNLSDSFDDFISHLNKREIFAVLELVNLYRNIKGEVSKKVKENILTSIKKYLPMVAICEGFDSLESKRRIIENVNKAFNFPLPDDIDFDLYKALFYDVSVAQTLKGYFIEIYNSVNIEYQNAIFDIVLRSESYDEIDLKFIFDKIPHMVNSGSSMTFTRIYDFLKNKINLSSQQVLLNLINQMSNHWVYLFFKLYVPFDSSLYELLVMFLKEYYVHIFEVKSADLTSFISRSKYNLQINSYPYTQYQMSHSPDSHSRTAFNILRYLMSKNINCCNNNLVLLIYESLFRCEFNPDLDIMVNWYFSSFTYSEVESLYKINPSFQVSSSKIIENILISNNNEIRYWLLSNLKRMILSKSYSEYERTAILLTDKERCVSESFAPEKEDNIHDFTSESMLSVNSWTIFYDESSVLDRDDSVVELNNDERINSNLNHNISDGIDNAQTKLGEGINDASTKLGDSINNIQTKLSDRINNAPTKLNDGINNSQTKLNGGINNPSTKYHANNLNNSSHALTGDGNGSANTSHLLANNTSNGNNYNTSTATSVHASNNLTSSRGNANNYKLDALVNVYKDNPVLILEFFSEIDFMCHQALEIAKLYIDDKNVKYVALYYLSRFEPDPNYFARVFTLNYNERSYTIKTLCILIDKYGVEPFVPNIKKVLHAELRSKSVQLILLPLIYIRKQIADHPEILHGLCVLAYKMFIKGDINFDLLELIQEKIDSLFNKKITIKNNLYENISKNNLYENISKTNNLYENKSTNNSFENKSANNSFENKSDIESSGNPSATLQFESKKQACDFLSSITVENIKDQELAMLTVHMKLLRELNTLVILNNRHTFLSISKHDNFDFRRVFEFISVKDLFSYLARIGLDSFLEYKIDIIKLFLKSPFCDLSEEMIKKLGISYEYFVDSTPENQIVILEFIIQESKQDEMFDIVIALLTSLAKARYPKYARFTEICSKLIRQYPNKMAMWMINLYKTEAQVYKPLLMLASDIILLADCSIILPMLLSGLPRVSYTSYLINLLPFFKRYQNAFEIFRKDFFNGCLSDYMPIRELYLQIFLKRVPRNPVQAFEYFLRLDFSDVSEVSIQKIFGIIILHTCTFIQANISDVIVRCKNILKIIDFERHSGACCCRAFCIERSNVSNDKCVCESCGKCDCGSGCGKSGDEKLNDNCGRSLNINNCSESIDNSCKNNCGESLNNKNTTDNNKKSCKNTGKKNTNSAKNNSVVRVRLNNMLDNELMKSYRPGAFVHVNELALFSNNPQSIVDTLKTFFSFFSKESLFHLYRILASCSHPYKIRKLLFEAFDQQGFSVIDLYYCPYNPNLRYYLAIEDRPLYYGLIKCTSGIRELKEVAKLCIMEKYDLALSRIFDILKGIEARQISYKKEDVRVMEEIIDFIYKEFDIQKPRMKFNDEQFIYKEGSIYSPKSFLNSSDALYSCFIKDYETEIHLREAEDLTNKVIEINKDTEKFFIPEDIIEAASRIKTGLMKLVNIPAHTYAREKIMLYNSILGEIIESKSLIGVSSIESVFGRLRMWRVRGPTNTYTLHDWVIFIRWRTFIFYCAYIRAFDDLKKKISSEICKIYYSYAIKLYEEGLYLKSAFILNEFNNVTAVENSLMTEKCVLDFKCLAKMGDYQTIISLINSLNIHKVCEKNENDKARIYYYLYDAYKKVNKPVEAERFNTLSKKLGDIIENKKNDLSVARERKNNLKLSLETVEIKEERIKLLKEYDDAYNNYSLLLVDIINELSIKEGREFVIELLLNCDCELLSRISQERLYFFIPQIYQKFYHTEKSSSLANIENKSGVNKSMEWIDYVIDNNNSVNDTLNSKGIGSNLNGKIKDSNLDGNGMDSNMFTRNTYSNDMNSKSMDSNLNGKSIDSNNMNARNTYSDDMNVRNTYSNHINTRNVEESPSALSENYGDSNFERKEQNLFGDRSDSTFSSIPEDNRDVKYYNSRRNSALKNLFKLFNNNHVLYSTGELLSMLETLAKNAIKTTGRFQKAKKEYLERFKNYEKNQSSGSDSDIEYRCVPLKGNQDDVFAPGLCMFCPKHSNGFTGDYDPEKSCLLHNKLNYPKDAVKSKGELAYIKKYGVNLYKFYKATETYLSYETISMFNYSDSCGLVHSFENDVAHPGEFTALRDDYSKIKFVAYVETFNSEFDKNHCIFYLRNTDGSISKIKVDVDKIIADDKNNVFEHLINVPPVNQVLMLLDQFVSNNYLKKVGFSVNTVPIFSGFTIFNLNAFDLESVFRLFDLRKRKNIAKRITSYFEFKTKSGSKLEAFSKSVEAFKHIFKQEMLERLVDTNDFFTFKRTFVNSYASLIPVFSIVGLSCNDLDRLFMETTTGRCIYTPSIEEGLSKRFFIRPNISNFIGDDGLNGPLVATLFRFSESFVNSNASKMLINLMFGQNVSEDAVRKMEKIVFNGTDDNSNSADLLVNEMMDPKVGLMAVPIYKAPWL